MSYAHSVAIVPEFFIKAFHDYSDRYWAFAREILQNSIDCGARRIEIQVLDAMDGDSAVLQALAIVRDDSWAAASRFMRDLGDPIVEGGNTAAFEPLDLGHARRVLEWFGRACGSLPGGSGELSTDQEDFLDRAISGLAECGQVLPIRLSLLAEAVRRRAWVPRTLEAVRTADVALSF